MLPLLGPIAALALAGILAACSRQPRADATWDVLTMGLPPAVAPKWAILNMGTYLLKQTHEPLFRLGTNGEYESRVLASWQRSPDSTRYRLCPKAGVRFDEGKTFDAGFLARFVEVFLRARRWPGAVSVDGGCVEVALRAAGGRFLGEFSRLENAPSLPTDDPDIELGLGPFRAVAVSKHLITLARKVPAPDGYDRILMRSYLGAGDPRLEDRSIEDFNRIPAEDVPAWVRDEYADYGGALLKTTGLLIDLPDRELRRTVYGCAPVRALRGAFQPRRRHFQDIAGILPVGMPGAARGLPRQDCPPHRAGRPRAPLVFLDWQSDNERQLREVFDAFARRTGIAVSIRPMSEADFAHAFFKRPRAFQLSVVSVDAVSPDYAAFFGPFLGDPIFLSDARVPAARSVYDRLLSESDAARRTGLASELERMLRSEALFLPLYQEVRPSFYPRDMRGLALGQDFLGYPDVGELRR